MAEIQESSNNAIESARTIFAVDSPLLNFIVAVLVAYVIIYFITFYLGPVLFGLRPYRPFPIFARRMHHVVRRAVEMMNDEPGMDLSEKVSSAIEDMNN